MSVVHGVRAFSSLKSRAAPVRFGEVEMLVASLADVIASKKARTARAIAQFRDSAKDAA